MQATAQVRSLLAMLALPSICAAAQIESRPTITYPRAWCKPVDIARARRNIERHAWAKRLHDGYRQTAAFYLEHDPAFLAAFVPEKTPLLTIPCPKCGVGPWYWCELSADGETLVCTSCNTQYPRDPNDRSETWNVQGVIRAERIARIAQGLDAPAILYQLDGQRRYAEQIAPVIERFAEVFRRYRMNKVNENVWLDRNHHYYGKIDGWKHRDGSIIHKFLKAYDLIRDSGVYSDAQKEKIDRDLVRYALDYFLEGYGATGPLSLQYSTQDQGCPWLCAAAAAAMLDDRKAMGVMIDVWERMVDPANGFFFEDGAFYQCTPGYNWMLLSSSLELPKILSGNISPAIYDNPRCARLEKVYSWFLDAKFPDRTMPALNDGHVQARMDPVFAEAAWLHFGNQKALRYMKEAWGEDLAGGTEYSLFYRDAEASAAGPGADYGTESVHLPGIGLMILRHGQPKSAQTTAFIDYGPGAPEHHKHRDYLNFDLFACGFEMIPEYGYPWNPTWARLWGRSPQAHKTVVEEADQPERGEPLIWCVTPGPQLAEAGRPPRNARCIVLLPRTEGKPLLVDIFRVADENAPQLAWTTSARSPSMEVEGVEKLEPVELAQPLKEGRRGRVAEMLRAHWRFTAPQPCGLELLMPVRQPAEAIVAQAPPEEDVIRETHTSGGKLKDGIVPPSRGYLQVRYHGGRGVFVAVYAPYRGDQPAAVDAAWEPIKGRPEAVALQVRAGQDRFLVLHDPADGTTRFGQLELDGRAAVAVYRNDVLQSLTLAAGRRAACGDALIERHKTENGYVATAPAKPNRQ